MDLDNAVKAHAEWKIKLRAAIGTKVSVDARTIGADNCCPLGMWLHGDGKKQFGSHEKFSACLQKHAAFHREAGKVALVINEGKYDEAEAMLGGGTAYMNASNEAGAAIMGLKRAVAATA